MSKKIKLLIDDRSLRKKLGENARNHIIKEHNPQYILDGILQIYKTCLEKK